MRGRDYQRRDTPTLNHSLMKEKRPSCRRTNNTELKMDGGARKEARCGKQNAGKEVGKRLTALNCGDQKGG